MTLAGTVAMVILPLAGWAMPAALLLQENPPAQVATPEATPVPSPSPAQTPATARPAKKRPRRQKGAKKAANTKKVVRNGSTEEPTVQIVPGMSDAQASEHRQGTAQLLASTDANLKKLDSQQLDSSKLEIVKQIQTYVEQARTAEAAGDLDRAHNLAVKAQLLSDDLVRH
jgi:hypothetical protein